MAKGNPSPLLTQIAKENTKILNQGYIIPAPTPEMIEHILSRKSGEKVLKDRETALSLVNAYFQYVLAEKLDPDTGETLYVYKRPPSMAELATWLGVSRECLRKWKRDDEYGDIICAAVDICAAYNEQILLSPEIKNCVGNIFIAKSNFGYREDTNININVQSNLKQPKSIAEIAQSVDEDIIDIDYEEI